MSVMLFFPLVGVIFTLYSFYRAYNLAHLLNHPKKVQFSLNRSIPVIYQKFDFYTKDGIKLKGIDMKPKMKTKGTILVCHYLGGSKEQILPFVECLLRTGFRIVSFDFRNHGESQSDNRIKFCLEDDFDSFIEIVKQKVEAESFGIIGFSMGATSALFGLGKYPEIKAAVIDSGPLILVKEYFLYTLNEKKVKNPLTRFFFLTIYLYYAGFNRMSKNTFKILQPIVNKQVLLIHGDKDNIIPIENAEIVLKYLDPKCTILWRVPNSRHLTNRFLRTREYEQNVVQFFIDNLCGGCP
jgi:pimeloyl-ACP methyl ester carboxylesterase